jgi:hypothetical protein
MKLIVQNVNITLQIVISKIFFDNFIAINRFNEITFMFKLLNLTIRKKNVKNNFFTIH